jgi:protein-S-isoprenylcysteine O-methyltransferase Ste14
MIALVAASLIAPARPLSWGAPLLVALFLLGQAVAIVARLQLGPSWGLGIRPRTRGPATRTGLYAVMSHPIYTGTGVAIAAQAAILRNAPALILTIVGIFVIALKVSREQRWLGARTPRG